MTWTNFWLRAKTLFRRSQLDRDLKDEMAFHRAMREASNREAGMTPPDAGREAARYFGNATLVREELRRQWTFTSAETWLQDLRYALRTLCKSPAIALVVVLSLALGIGANTAIFSVMNAAMLRMLPVPEPERLMLFSWTARGWPARVMDDLEGASRITNGVGWSYSLPYDAFRYIRAHSQSFDNVVGFAANNDEMNIGMNGRAESAVVQAVSGNFFDGMRVGPILGRSISDRDDAEDAPPVAMVSYQFWRSRMAADPAVSGKTITINGQPVTVVGVLPPEFYGVEPGSPPAVYVTLASFIDAMKRVGDFDVKSPKVWWLGVVGRMKPQVNGAQAQAELNVLFDQAIGIGSKELPRGEDLPKIGMTPLSHGLDSLRRRYSTSLLLLMGMVGLVLLIACANVAGLLLARATARQREIAVRLSLGAARWRIVRQLLTESILLALLGGAAGLLVARWTAAGLMLIFAGARHPVDLPVSVDATVLLFTAAVSLLCGILFGLAPALRATRVNVYPTLKQNADGSRGTRRFLSGRILVSGQVALCLLLVVCAGLLLGTLRRLQNVQLGFDDHRLVSFMVQPGLNGLKGEPLISYYAELQRRLGSIPGVHSVGLSQLGPIGSGSSSTDVVLPGYTEPGKRADFYRHIVDGNYFQALRIPVLLGRAVGERDTESTPLVAAVNQRAVREYFHGDNPIGHTIDLGKTGTTHALATIVGVVGDVKYNQIREDAPPTMYLSYLQRSQSATFMTFLVRAEGNDGNISAAIQREALATNKDVPVINLRTEESVVHQVLLLERLFAVLGTSFSALALLLACVGLYGTIGYIVARRTNEIGIRMALGAGRGAILGMILSETAVIVGAGILVGLPLAWFASLLLKAQLFEMSPHDPATIMLAVAAIVGVTLIAGFLPARRASRVDPMAALRYE